MTRESYRISGRGKIIGQSKSMQTVYRVLDRLAKTDATVLVTGETGTGKELIAEALHYNSGRSSGNLVSINCANFADSLIDSELFGHVKGAFTGANSEYQGKLSYADKGTLFLDEIGDMNPELQSRLLRVLDSGEYNRIGSNTPMKSKARIIAATNKHLEEEMYSGSFREDLYHRLNLINIWLSPLRDREDDIVLISDHFLKVFNRKYGAGIKRFSSKAIKRMKNYSWPGNVREMKNVVEKVILTKEDGDIIHDYDLPLADGITFISEIESPDAPKLHDIKYSPKWGEIREREGFSQEGLALLLWEDTPSKEGLRLLSKIEKGKLKGINFEVLSPYFSWLEQQGLQILKGVFPN